MTADSDSLYHRLFSHPLMVEQLVREFIPEAMAVGLDFAAMERVNAKFHSAKGKRREGDLIWRLPTHDGTDVYLYLLLEFQSTLSKPLEVCAHGETKQACGGSASGTTACVAEPPQACLVWTMAVRTQVYTGLL